MISDPVVQIRRRLWKPFLVWICILGLFASARGWQAILPAIIDRFNGGTDPVTAQEERLADLKRDIPPLTRVVGYAIQNDSFSNNEEIAEFYRTQYFLAPVVVEFSADHPLVIGNFPGSETLPPELAEAFSVQEYYGAGLFLLRQK